MARYAATTVVEVEQTEIDIKKMLKKHKATDIVAGTVNNVVTVIFEMKGRRIRFNMPMPNDSELEQKIPDKVAVNQSNAMRKLTESERLARLLKIKMQEERTLWRVIFLSIKAKLEMVEAGANFEEEFLAQTVMSNNQTVVEWLKPQLSLMYDSGDMPPLLPGMRGQAQWAD